jgi:hypothetical protein
MSNEIEKLPRLLARAVATLEKATTAAEFLEAADQADVAYTAAKLAARLSKIKDAHDSVLVACRKTMADALVITARAQCRLADEYDAAQDRGELAKRGDLGRGDKTSQREVISTTADTGLTHKQIHEARKIRNAEKAKPGIIRKAVDAKLDANEEPTRADVKRAISNKPKKDKVTKGRQAGPQPQRRTTTQNIEQIAASLVLDHGKTYEQARTELGLQSVQPIKTAVAREEGRRELTVDRADLSATAQQKLDAAIRQQKSKLEASFYKAVNDRVRQFLEETILPTHRKEQDEAKRVMQARKGVMDKTTFNKIRRCLHPDSRKSVSDRVLGEGFDAFMRLEKRLLDEKDSPTDYQPLPKTMAEWDALKRKATEQRKASYAARQAVRPR